MKKIILTLLLLFTSFFLFGQEYDDLYFNSNDRINYKKINPEYVESIALKEYRGEIYDDEILRAVPNYLYWNTHWSINMWHWNRFHRWNVWYNFWYDPIFWGGWGFSSYYWLNPWHDPFYVWGGWRYPGFYYNWSWWHWHHVPRTINVYNYNRQSFRSSTTIIEKPIRTNVSVGRVERSASRINNSSVYKYNSERNINNRPSTINRYERPSQSPTYNRPSRSYIPAQSRPSTPSYSRPSRSYTPNRQSTPSRTYTPSPSRQSAPSYYPSRSYTPSRQSTPSYSRPSTGRRQ